MAFEAIFQLKNRNGSSLKAIRSYINTHFKANNLAVLKRALNKACESGSIVKYRSNYKLIQAEKKKLQQRLNKKINNNAKALIKEVQTSKSATSSSSTKPPLLDQHLIFVSLAAIGFGLGGKMRSFFLLRSNFSSAKSSLYPFLFRMPPFPFFFIFPLFP